MRRVTFSRNFTLSLSRTCRCYCKYCAFATHRAHLYSPDEVEGFIEEAVRRNSKELLVLTGEKPEVNAEVAARLREYGHDDFTSYVAWACERALDRGLLPHTNLGVLSHDELARLREVTASQGLMLESVNPDLEVHRGSPTKHPQRRLETIRAAGELKIPFTTGILVGIGETPDERIAALEAIAEVHAEHGHVQEVILQNFVPHPRYYGAEPAEIADAAQREGTEGEAAPMPEWGSEVSLDEMRRLVRESRRADARRGRADPAEPGRLVAAAGRRGRHRPGRAVGQRRPHLARAPVPLAPQDAPGAVRQRPRAGRAPVRVPPVHGLRVARAGRARRDQGEVLELHPAPRLRAARGARDPQRPGARARSGARATATR